MYINMSYVCVLVLILSTIIGVLGYFYNKKINECSPSIKSPESPPKSPESQIPPSLEKQFTQTSI